LRSSWRSAELEASEEAGVVGKVQKKPVGEYQYTKRLRSGMPLACTVKVFALEVSAQLLSWPERNQGKLLWLPPAEAAEHVQDGS
jgi:8-oxo-dGTP pyrophosphatase MutT (NUDIX family)